MAQKPQKKQITNLNQIDIAKMNINDLQNIDYQKLLSSIRKKPDIAISIVIPLLAIFVCFNIFTKSAIERRTLTNKNQEMEEKLTALSEYKTVENELQALLTSLSSKITENDFINTITDFATKNNIEIESFSPAQNKSDPIYDLTMINLSANTKNYNDIIKFITEIENSKANIRINSWSGSKGISQGGSRRGRNPSNPEDLSINFRLDLALVTFKQ
jgi:Tfp pilus assembly protein PilO